MASLSITASSLRWGAREDSLELGSDQTGGCLLLSPGSPRVTPLSLSPRPLSAPLRALGIHRRGLLCSEA